MWKLIVSHDLWKTHIILEKHVGLHKTPKNHFGDIKFPGT